MQPVRFPAYTVAGALTGAAFTGLGAIALHPFDEDHYQRRGAALAGLIGGGITHVAFGAIAAFAPAYEAKREAMHLGASTTLSALTSGLIGGAVLGASGYSSHPSPSHEVLAGVVGATLLVGAASVASCLMCLVCCRCPAWRSQVRGDGGLGERFLAERGAEQA